MLLVDEAYIHFSDSPELASAVEHVRAGKDVIVARTFSKLYGMAGLRIGFACAKPELIRRLEPLRNMVISCVGVQAARAALGESAILIPERRARMTRLRGALCGWLRERRIPYIEPHGNFVMIDVGRPVRPFISEMAGRGVAPERPFPPLDTMMRVSIGTEAEMARFREVFEQVYKG